MWYVLLNLLSSALCNLPPVSHVWNRKLCVIMSVCVCVCVKPNPLWNADLMSCLMRFKNMGRTEIEKR